MAKWPSHSSETSTKGTPEKTPCQELSHVVGNYRNDSGAAFCEETNVVLYKF